MAEPIHPPEIKLETDQKEVLGLLETYGTFPIWMLKAIQAVTPDFLMEQSQAPEEQETRPQTE